MRPSRIHRFLSGAFSPALSYRFTSFGPQLDQVMEVGVVGVQLSIIRKRPRQPCASPHARTPQTRALSALVGLSTFADAVTIAKCAPPLSIGDTLCRARNAARHLVLPVVIVVNDCFCCGVATGSSSAVAAV